MSINDAVSAAADAPVAVGIAADCKLALLGPAGAAAVVEEGCAFRLAVLGFAAASAGCSLSSAYLAATSDNAKFFVIWTRSKPAAAAALHQTADNIHEEQPSEIRLHQHSS
jgi:hypothetical protein